MAEDHAKALQQVAREDEFAEIRKAALSRIHDLKFLWKAIGDEQDRDVREFANRHLSKILAGVNQEHHSLTTRQDFLRSHPIQEVLEYVALHGAEPELRKTAQDTIKQPQLLGEIAVKDPIFANRLAALERISETAVLEKVFRETRKHDKQINRLSKSKLDELLEAETRNARHRLDCETLCGRMESLGRGEDWEQELNDFEGLENRWKELSSDADSVFQERYATARTKFLTVSAEYRETRAAQEQAWMAAREARQSILKALISRLDEMQTLEIPDEALEARYRSDLKDWQSAWNTMPELPETQAKPLQNAYVEHLQTMQNQLERFKTRRETEATLRRLVDEAQKLLDAKNPISESQIKSLDRRWEAQHGAIDLPLLVAAADRYAELHQHLRERLIHQVEKRKKEFEKLPEMLEKLEASLNDKVLKEAIPMHDRLQNSLVHLQALGMPKDKLAPFARRLHRLTPQVRELQSWRTWGTDEVRERLCEEMEALIGSEEKPAELAARVRHIRSEWNRLRSDGGVTGKTLRKRFDAAANEAYKPCEAFFKQQSAQRSSNLEKKHELLRQLETYLESVEWSHMDWKAAVKFHRQLINDWRHTGPVDRREAKEVDRRYQQTMAVLDEHLELEHKRNLEQRKALTQQVQSLAHLEDISKAIDECKRFQSQWQTTVPGKRKLENELWQEFREACDAVFARRKQQQDERQAEEQQHKARKQAICEDVEQLSKVEIDGLEEAERKLHKWVDEWKEVGAVPKRDASALEQRFEKAMDHFRQHQSALRAAEEQAQLNLLREKASLCSRLERKLEDSQADDEPAVMEQQWSSLAPLSDTETNALIEKRYTQIIEALRDESGEKRASLQRELEANLEWRKELCLRMEILSGVESPPELQQARMEFQANRLAEAMGQGEEDPIGKIAELQRSWCLTGAAPATEEAKLQQRFERGRKAAESHQG